MAVKDKKYYWLKLKRDFFKRHDIQIIESMPNGKDYILFYLKLLCESVDHEGKLRFSDAIPYNEQMLATITNTNVDVVRSAIKVFGELRMMEVMDDGTYYMREVNKMIGEESYWAQQKRAQRAKIAEIGQIPTLSNESPTCPSKSIEKEIETEKEIDIKTFCPEPDKSASGLESATESPTADNSAKGIGAAPGDGAKVIGTGAEMKVEKAAEPSPEVFIQLPLNTGAMFDVTVDYVREMQKLYPGIDAEQQFRAMRGWLDNNPKNRKTAKGIGRFMNGWLSREQDRAPRVKNDQQTRPYKKAGSFFNFEQSNTDWNAVAEKIMYEQEERDSRAMRDG